MRIGKGILVLLGVFGANVCFGDLYRYVDDKGVVVLDRHGVPSQYIGKGYEVLNEQGRVIRVVQAAPTAQERQLLLEAEARANSDLQLLRLYASVQDVERAKKRKLAELDGVIGIARSNLQALHTQQDNLQSQAANHERAGREVPESLLVQIGNLKKEQASLQRDIDRYLKVREEAEGSFGRDQARLAQLLGDAR